MTAIDPMADLRRSLELAKATLKHLSMPTKTVEQRIARATWYRDECARLGDTATVTEMNQELSMLAGAAPKRKGWFSK